MLRFQDTYCGSVLKDFSLSLNYVIAERKE